MLMFTCIMGLGIMESIGHGQDQAKTNPGQLLEGRIHLVLENGVIAAQILLVLISDANLMIWYFLRYVFKRQKAKKNTKQAKVLPMDIGQANMIPIVIPQKVKPTFSDILGIIRSTKIDKELATSLKRISVCKAQTKKTHSTKLPENMSQPTRQSTNQMLPGVIIESKGIATSGDQNLMKLPSPPPLNDGTSIFKFPEGIGQVESYNFDNHGMSMNSAMIVQCKPLSTSISPLIRTPFKTRKGLVSSRFKPSPKSARPDTNEPSGSKMPHQNHDNSGENKVFSVGVYSPTPIDKMELPRKAYKVPRGKSRKISM